MRLVSLAAAAACLIALALPAAAASVAVTPATIAAAWPAAACGDQLVATGEFVKTVLSTKACAANPIKLDMRAASGVTWRVIDVDGLAITGGTWRNANLGVALSFEGGQVGGVPTWKCGHISITAARFEGPFAAVIGQPFVGGGGKGVGFLRCSDVSVTASELTGFASSALFGVSRRVTFSDNHCRHQSGDCAAFGQVWGATVERNVVDGAIIFAGAHPDGFQFYSRWNYPATTVPAPPTSDLFIANNMVAAPAQGVFLGNHTRLYPDGLVHDDGGFDRVTIERNEIAMGGGNAIGVSGVRGLVLRWNHWRTFALAPFKASVNVQASSGVVRCGNRGEAARGYPVEVDAPCP